MAKSRNQAQLVRGQLWVHFEGHTFTYESEEKSLLNQKKSKGSNSGIIISPMPGKITRLFKKPTDSVEVGEALIVMEAMKMEYTLKANVNGSIKKMNCQVGDQVSLSQVLIEIAEEKVDEKK